MAINKHELVGCPWREYDFVDPRTGVNRIYRIERPVYLYTATNGITHRIEDSSGVVHIVPAPGHFGCVLRYIKDEGVEKVTF